MQTVFQNPECFPMLSEQIPWPNPSQSFEFHIRGVGRALNDSFLISGNAISTDYVPKEDFTSYLPKNGITPPIFGVDKKTGICKISSDLIADLPHSIIHTFTEIDPGKMDAYKYKFDSATIRMATPEELMLVNAKDEFFYVVVCSVRMKISLK